jgi:hypothetical protein
MTKKPVKRVAEKGKPMEMRALKADYGSVSFYELARHQFKRASSPDPANLPPPPSGNDSLKEAFEILASAMQNVNVMVSKIARLLNK